MGGIGTCKQPYLDTQLYTNKQAISAIFHRTMYSNKLNRLASVDVIRPSPSSVKLAWATTLTCAWYDINTQDELMSWITG